MVAMRENLTIEQGTTFRKSWEATVDSVLINDTWIARSQVRATKSRTAALLHAFKAEVDARGYVTISVTPVQSSAWKWTKGNFDVEIESSTGLVLRLVEGKVIVRPEITA